jgi:hypothetical protein
MISKDAVLKIVQQKGPVIPNDIRKEMGGENILISAILSELSQNGKVKITHTKIGGSPAYYAPGTEERLQGLMKYLNQKDKETAELLMQKKVLKDTDLTPLLRVSLRNIRDFAKPLEVNVRGVKEIYWKWYMLPTPDAEKLIMGSVKPSKKPEVLTPKKPLQPIAIKEEPKIIAKPETKAEAKKEEPKKAEIKKEELKKIEVKKEDMQTSLGLGVEELEKEKDPFFKKVLAYFKENEIQVLEYKVLRKNSEIDLMITVPSRIGSHEYYCKAKNKKKVNDGELSSIYVQSQAKRLPVIFITTGELTKKAKEMLAKDFKGMIVKRI